MTRASEALAPLLLVLPMAGFLLTALIGRRLGKQAHWIPVLAIFAVWVIAMGLVFQVLTGAAPIIGGEGEEPSTATRSSLFTWIPAGEFVVDVGIFIDPLTACLLIVVTTIGLLVHVYSIGYMSHDPGYWRFFAYLNLFMFSMLLLVLPSSWLVVFVAWELVGLSSYLLIGFWYRKRSAMLAAKKAFIVNRVGDVGFALGIMAIFVNTERGRRRRRSTSASRSTTLLEAGRRQPDPAVRGRPARVRRGDGQERPVPAARLAARRDGGPDPGVRPHPRGDDGQRRRVPRGPGQPALRQRPGRDGHRRGHRHLHGHPRGEHRDDPDRHQAGPRLLDAEPARLHVRGARRRGVHRGHLPPHDPRLLQGPAVPRLRLGHPRRPRGAGHAQHGRPEQEDPDHLRDDAHRLDRHRRHPAAGRLLLQGRDPRRGLQVRLLLGLGHRPVRRPADRVLHVPAHGPDLLGLVPRPEGGLGQDPRVAAG